MNQKYLQEIIYITWRADPGGMEKTIKQYLEHFRDQYYISLISIKPPRTEFLTQYPQFKSLKNNAYLALIKLGIILVRNRSVKYHLFNTGPIVLLVTLILTKSLVIYHIHGTRFLKIRFLCSLYKRMWFKCLKHKNLLIISNSRYSRSCFHSQIDKKAIIKILYNPFDLNQFSRITRMRDENFKVGYVGRLVEGKNLIKWIEIAEDIIKSGYKFTFCIFGEGPLRIKISQLIKDKNLDNQIHIEGFKSDIKDIYSKLDLLLFLSDYESFGNVVIESILFKVPVIATNIPSLQEIFCNYPEFLIDSNELSAFTIIQKLNDYSRLMSLTESANREFKITFNSQKHYRALQNMYDK